MTFKGKTDADQREKTAEEGYDLYASSYVSDEEKLNRFDIKMLMRALRLLKGKRVLDAGCGTGRLASLLKRREADNVVGMDISQEMLNIAQKTGAYTEVVRADLSQELPFDWNAFDVILCSMVLVHIPQKLLPEVFSELYRVTAPGGDIYIVNLPQRRPPRLTLPDGESIFITSYVHADSSIIEELEMAGYKNILIDEHREGKEHFATLIKATKN